MKFEESVRPEVWTKRAGVLQFDFQFAYSPLASIIVRWYHRIFKKIENVVSAFDQALFERNELLTKPVYILFEQIVQTPGPWHLVYNVARISIPFVNSLTEQIGYFLLGSFFFIFKVWQFGFNRVICNAAY